MRPNVPVADHQTHSPLSSDTNVFADHEPLGFRGYETRKLGFGLDHERSSVDDDGCPYRAVPLSRDWWGSGYLAQSAEESSHEIPRLCRSPLIQTNRRDVGSEFRPRWPHPLH